MKRLFIVTLALLLAACSVAGSTQARETQRIRVALFLGQGAHARPALKDGLLQGSDFDTKIIRGEDVRDGSLANYDILVVPGGSAKAEAVDMTEEGRREVRRFVESGGAYMGICAGCYLSSAAKPHYLGLIPLKTADPEHWHRGKAMLPIEFTPLGMEVFGVKEANQRVLYHNGPVFAAPDHQLDPGELAPLCFYRGEAVAPGGQPGLMTGAPAMLLEHYGRGLVLAISPHPEGTPGLEHIELHAVRWLYDQTHRR